MKTTVRIEGGCLCGGTRYVLESEPTELNDCHCADCRRASGAPFVTWGAVPRDRMRVTRGELRHVRHAARIRSFAACCGTPLFFAASLETASIDVTIASLDDPAPWPPAITIWTEDRLPWVPLHPHRPTYLRDTRS